MLTSRRKQRRSAPTQILLPCNTQGDEKSNLLPKPSQITKNGYSFSSKTHDETLHNVAYNYHQMHPQLVQIIISYIESPLNTPNNNSFLKRLPKTDIFQYKSPYAPSHFKFWITIFAKLVLSIIFNFCYCFFFWVGINQTVLYYLYSTFQID